MKKIVIIDGGPRKNMNTAAMIEAFTRGVKSVGEEIDVKRVFLYDIDYKGCRIRIIATIVPNTCPWWLSTR